MTLHGRKIFRTLLVLLSAVIFLTMPVSAQQSFRSAYFLDGYNYAYRLNPAIMGERGFFSPVIGNNSVDLQCTLPLTTFLYKIDGKAVSFADSRIGREEFLRNVQAVNKISASVDNTVFAVGFWLGKSYNTIELNSRTDLGINAPYEMFDFLKSNQDGRSDVYKIGRMGFKASSTLELAYGYSRRVARWMTFGFRVKALAGVASAESVISSADFEYSGDSWNVRAIGDCSFCFPNAVSLKTIGDTDPSSPLADVLDFKNVSMSRKVKDYFALPGYGGALDIGFTFDFGEYVTVSAAVTDLGIMYWHKCIYAKTAIDTWKYEGFKESEEDRPSDITPVLDGILECFNYHNEPAPKDRRLKMLSPTVNAGVQFRIPGFQRLSLGVLGTAKIDGRMLSWFEGRFSVNLALLNWLSMTGNYAYSSFGHGAGVALNIHTRGFGLFVGTDSLIPYTKWENGLPTYKLNTSANFGINFNFGPKHSRFGKDSIRPEDDFSVKNRKSDI